MQAARIYFNKLQSEVMSDKLTHLITSHSRIWLLFAVQFINYRNRTTFIFYVLVLQLHFAYSVA